MPPRCTAAWPLLGPDWHNALNWAGGQVPDSNDRALLGNADTFISQVHYARAFQGSGTLTVQNTFWDMYGPPGVGSLIGTLRLKDSWIAGYEARVRAGSLWLSNATVGEHLDGRNPRLSIGAVGVFLDDACIAPCERSIWAANVPAGEFINAGSDIKRGEYRSMLGLGLHFSNLGSIVAQQGQLRLHGVDNIGTLRADGGRIRVSGPAQWQLATRTLTVQRGIGKLGETTCINDDFDDERAEPVLACAVPHLASADGFLA